MIKQVTIRAALLAFCTTLSVAAHAVADAPKRVDISAGELPQALLQLAEHFGADLVYRPEQVYGLKTHGVHGYLTTEQAVTKLLEGTPLELRADPSGGMLIAPAAMDAAPALSAADALPTTSNGDSVKEGKNNSSSQFRVAEVDRGAPSSANALEKGGRSSEPKSGGLEEIVVTAQKKDERISQVPQSITAIGGESLRGSDVQTLQDLAAAVPGMTITGLGGAGSNQIILRGISSGYDISPLVAVYVDDIPYGSVTAQSSFVNVAFETGSFDLQRVEVLRGPQGTLYGASAFGGLVKYVLAPPSLDRVEGKVQLDGSNTEGGGFNNGVRAAVNLPLIADSLAVRVSLIRNHDAGFIDNAFNGASNINASTTTAGRVAVLAKPSDWLTLRATVLGQDIKRDGTDMVDFDGASGTAAFGDLRQSTLIAQPFDQTYRLYSAGGDADLGFAVASATFGYQTNRTASVEEGPLYTALLGPVLASLGHPINDAALAVTPYGNIKTAELRLASKPKSALEWLGGLYYTRESNYFTNDIIGYLNGAPIPFSVATYDAPTSYKEYAAFGDVTYHFSEKFDAQLGARYSHNEQNISQSFGDGVLTGPTASNDKSSANVATYLATARYHFNDSSMAYARIASGYRPGGPNTQVLDPASGAVLGASSFAADSIWNYEFGVKLSPNRMFSIDASVFHIDWKNIQLTSVVDGLSAFVNGGRAKSDGIETALSFLPIDDLTLSVAAAYTNARLVDAVPSIMAQSGERLPNAPRFSSSLRADYRADLGGGWKGFAGANWSYIGDRNLTFDGSTDPTQYNLPGYQRIDLRAGAEHGAWNISLYAKNVANKRGEIAADTSLAFPVYRISVIQPRTIGVLLTLTF